MRAVGVPSLLSKQSSPLSSPGCKQSTGSLEYDKVAQQGMFLGFRSDHQKKDSLD